MVKIIYGGKDEHITKIIDDSIRDMNTVQKQFYFVRDVGNEFEYPNVREEHLKTYKPKGNDYEIHIISFAFTESNWCSYEGAFGGKSFSVITLERQHLPSELELPLKAYLVYRILASCLLFAAVNSKKPKIKKVTNLGDLIVNHDQSSACLLSPPNFHHSQMMFVCDKCRRILKDDYDVGDSVFSALERIMAVACLESKKMGVTTIDTNTKNVFIVHGHDSELKLKVENLLQQIKLNPIILSEQTHSCRSIMEEIEKHGNKASAAVVLFTPDDFGNVKSAEEKNPRARQNVVFEAGYFMALLGRDKVILIKSDKNIEMPSDLGGILYSETIEMKLTIARELKDMGFDIDLNKLM